MTPYPEYKATSLPWLPQIPAHWDWLMLSQLTEEQCVKNIGCLENNVLSLSYGNIVRKKNIYSGLSPQDFATYQIVYQDNIILRLTDLQNDHRSLRTGLVKEKGIITSAYTCLKVHSNASFVHYLLHAYDLRKVFYGMGGGVRQSIGFKDIRSLRFPVAPVAEQEQIVRYLDSMTAKINKLIRAKKNQIALLQEQKQAIINQAVTKGLNPNAEMKDSGIDWLGQIPAHWEISRCKYLLRETNFRSENGDEEHLSMSQKDGLIPDSQLDGHHLMSESYIGGKICKKNDLVLNRLKAHLGVFALAPQLGVVSPDYTILNINCKKVLPRYIEHVLKSNSCRSELRIRVRGIVEGFWRLYTDDLYDITLPLPSIEEQQQILNSAEEKTKILDKCLSDCVENIKLLKEYLDSLIASVVTGQVDVRNIAVEDFDPADLITETDDDPAKDESPEESEE